MQDKTCTPGIVVPGMSRRTTLLAMAGTLAAPLVMSSIARAQMAPGMAMSGSGDEYTMKTLMVGGLALATSKQALYKATSDPVKQFAPLEVGEQETIANILAARGITPPPMTPEQKDKLTKLEAMSGKDYDKAYVTAQIEGHNELLAIQKMKEPGDPKDPEVIMAKLAVQSVTTHLVMLKMISTMI